MPKTKKQIEERRITFFTRSKSAIFVGAFYVLYFMLLIFADPNIFKPIAGNPKIAFVLNFLNVLLLVPIVYFVAREITNLCFPKRKGVFIYTVIALFVITVGTSVFLLGGRYFQWGRNNVNGLDEFGWYLVICIVGIAFFTALSTLVWIIMSKHIVYVGRKTRIWYPLLIFILNTFFVGFIYTSLIHGWSAAMFLILASTGCDVFAYIGGSFFGKHKLAPKISPKKTWEGVLFGVGVTLAILCGIVGILYIPGIEANDHALYCFLGNQSCSMENSKGFINLQPYYWAIYICVFIILMVVSICGDLFFSFIKRKFNIKDFSNLLPGHGGIMDRLDALIFIFTFYFVITIIIQLCMYAVPGTQTGLNYLWTRGLESVL